MKAFTLDDHIAIELKDPEFRLHYNRELLINAVAKMIVELRRSNNLTQMELAKKAKTTQSVIARLESGSDERVPSIDLLSRIASASDARLNISFTQQI